ncbi:FxsA family protein [Micromonospora peucetia]|uniref:FxsA family protein n=1 Tax=Micromonospora peucetia TaxID=47871 RepID=A0ABZ1EC29_9ACTN|nr:FxsA family protein [Micromonospora peucetia]MCX4391139.1 FxsA family protein [Micromonospora peucetia]WSA32057.1 FxsA family protein [Micromonospora peucetia]
MRRGLRFVPLALLAAVLLELVVFVAVGRAIGFGSTLLVVFAVSLLGLVLLRREGMRAWRGFRDSAQAGRPPGRQVTDGLVGLFGALLLATPGLLSGLVGLFLLVPPVRRLARNGVQRAAERRVSSMVAGDLFGPRRVRVRRGEPQPADSQPVAEPTVVDGGRAIEGEIVEPGRN